MALIKCSECGHEVSDKASSCPNCGNPVDRKSNGSWKKPIIGIAFFLIIIAGAFGIWNVLKGNTQSDIQITKELSEAIHRYDDISDFHEGLLAVCKNQKWGYINSKGKEVIPCKYEYSCDFSEGLACVYLEGDDLPIAFIDKNGNTVIEGFYGDTQQGGFWIISFENGKCFVFDKERDGFWIDKEGKKTNEPQETDKEDGVASDYVAFSDNGVYGMKDSLGNVVIEPKYSYIYNFSEGLALAYLYCGEKNICGLVDKKGNDTFTKEDFELFSSYREREQQRAKQAEEERKRQEEEAKLQGQEIIISMSADIDGIQFKNKQCNIGEVSTFWDQIISKRMKVRDGKVLIFKYHELNRHNSYLDWVGVDVYDKNGNAKHYETNSCGEFAIFEGETFRTRINLSVGNRGNHLDAKFHFREKDKDLY